VGCRLSGQSLSVELRAADLLTLWLDAAVFRH
jgi:hypothetical protein